MNCDLDTSVSDWIIEHSETEKVFGEFGLDSSCPGKSLRYVCIQQGVMPQEVLLRLQRAVRASTTVDRVVHRF